MTETIPRRDFKRFYPAMVTYWTSAKPSEEFASITTVVTGPYKVSYAKLSEYWREITLFLVMFFKICSLWVKPGLVELEAIF